MVNTRTRASGRDGGGSDSGSPRPSAGAFICR
jgi:hypothetical protein